MSLLTRRGLLLLSYLGCAMATAGCRSVAAVRLQPKEAVDAAVEKVLVVANSLSEDSVAIARYYMQRRRIPVANLCTISCPVTDEVSDQQYTTSIEKPVRAFIEQGKLAVEYIVLTKGIPIRVKGGSIAGLSTDAMIATMDISGIRSPARNPYFGKDEHFSHARYLMYLVTRLDGYSRADCTRLVDNSLAAKRLQGPFLLHTGLGHDNGGYRTVNVSMAEARNKLKAKGLVPIYSTGPTFPGDIGSLAGYFSWGSNDVRFDKKAYRSTRFAPGAIAETAVSTSARTFSNPDASGQSLIADLIAQGVTGCKGYVSEPFVLAIAVPDILFDRYTSGYNLAESFYMASRCARWKDVVIGDPLCAPYASETPAKP